MSDFLPLLTKLVTLDPGTIIDKLRSRVKIDATIRDHPDDVIRNVRVDKLSVRGDSSRSVEDQNRLDKWVRNSSNAHTSFRGVYGETTVPENDPTDRPIKFFLPRSHEIGHCDVNLRSSDTYLKQNTNGDYAMAGTITLTDEDRHKVLARDAELGRLLKSYDIQKKTYDRRLKAYERSQRSHPRYHPYPRPTVCARPPPEPTKSFVMELDVSQVRLGEHANNFIGPRQTRGFQIYTSLSMIQPNNKTNTGFMSDGNHSTYLFPDCKEGRHRYSTWFKTMHTVGTKRTNEKGEEVPELITLTNDRTSSNTSHKDETSGTANSSITRISDKSSSDTIGRRDSGYIILTTIARSIDKASCDTRQRRDIGYTTSKLITRDDEETSRYKRQKRDTGFRYNHRR